MSTCSSFKKVLVWVALFAFLLPTVGGFVSSAIAGDGDGGGSGDPMKPPPTNPGGTSYYKAPSVWYLWVLNYFKLRWGRWLVF